MIYKAFPNAFLNIYNFRLCLSFPLVSHKKHTTKRATICLRPKKKNKGIYILCGKNGLCMCGDFKPYDCDNQQWQQQSGTRKQHMAGPCQTPSLEAIATIALSNSFWLHKPLLLGNTFLGWWRDELAYGSFSQVAVVNSTFQPGCVCRNCWKSIWQRDQSCSYCRRVVLLIVHWRTRRCEAKYQEKNLENRRAIVI